MALKLPHGLDERAIEHFAERDRRTGQLKADAIFTDLSAAVKFAREQATSLVNLERAALADRTLTHEVALLQVANAALKSGERVATRLDAARAKARAEIDGITKRTASPPPPKDAVSLGLEQEIRARLASMPEKERRDAVAKAFSEGSEAIIAAVLRGPAMLVGMGQAEQDMLRHRYRETYHAADMARVERLQKALEATDRSGGMFVKLVTDASASPAARLAATNKLRHDEAAAAAATLGE